MAFVEVEINLEDIDTRDLVHELRYRGYKIDEDEEAEVQDINLVDLYEAKRYHPEKFDQLFSDYIWRVLGKQV